MHKFMKIVSAILCLTAFLALGGCAFHAESPAPKTIMPTEEPDTVVFEEGKPVNVTITMADGGVMKLELYHDKAPKTVENFVKLAKEGFYDGLTFHRIISGFMIQGGDPEGTGFGGSDETIPGEFAMNGFAQNDIPHVRGAISMARSQNPNSASSQFFIVHADANFLDGQYAAFGKVVEGMETVDAFLDVERAYNSMGEMASPKTPITMKKVTVID